MQFAGEGTLVVESLMHSLSCLVSPGLSLIEKPCLFLRLSTCLVCPEFALGDFGGEGKEVEPILEVSSLTMIKSSSNF